MNILSGEMLVGKPLFPGSSSIDQIEKIFTRIEVGPKSLNAIRRFCSDYAVGVAEKASAARKSSIFEDTLAGCDAVSLIVCFVIFFLWSFRLTILVEESSH